MQDILTVTNLSKTYRMGEVTVNALQEVSFGFASGEFIVILGPSGSGKSTIMNIIGGIDKPTSGTVVYKGQDIGQANDRTLTQYRRQAIGFVFQFYNLIPNLTARENVLLSAQLASNPLDTDQLLEQIGLADKGGHFPAQMSGGQQQRIAIARAMAKNPDLLLCDEPTGALDFATGIQVLHLLKDFCQSHGKTVAIITHNADIGHMADRVFYVKDGRIDKIVHNEKPLSPDEIKW